MDIIEAQDTLDGMERFVYADGAEGPVLADLFRLTHGALAAMARRLLVLAICATLARWEEFRLRVQAGLEQGGLE